MLALYRTVLQDYGMWERGDKTNHGLPELNSSSIGMAKVSSLTFTLTFTLTPILPTHPSTQTNTAVHSKSANGYLRVQSAHNLLTLTLRVFVVASLTYLVISYL